MTLTFSGHQETSDANGLRAAGIRQFARRQAILLVAVASLPGCVMQTPAQTGGASEYEIKAAYVYNFAKSAAWPEQNLPKGAPLVIGVMGGDDEFIDTMAKTVSGKTAGAHAISVRRVDSDEEISLCHVVFFRSSGGRKRTESAISALANSSILWVGEDNLFLREGGMINLVLKHGMVRFEVNREPMERAGIRLGAALLALANSDGGSANNPAAESVPSPAAGSTGDESRRLRVSAPPEYPEVARKMSIKGTVQVEASVRRDGSVRHVRVIGGHPMLADALVKAVMGWQYEPSTRESLIVVKFVFGQ